MAYYGSIAEICRQKSEVFIQVQGGFYSVYGFAVAGGKYATCIIDNANVFVELDKADFDKTLAASEFTDDGKLVAYRGNRCLQPTI